MLKKLFYSALTALGIIGIAATIIAICVSSGIGLGTLLPGMAGVVFIGYAELHMLRPGNIIKIKWLRAVVITIVCIGIASFIAIEAIIISYSSGSQQIGNVNFVVVAGSGIFPDGSISKTFEMRLNTAYEYLSEHEDTICIVTGGQGENEPYPEAQAMKAYLVQKGIEASRIAEESRSTDTKENMEFAVEIMETMYPDKEKTAVVVTSGYHMYRALMLAGHSGIEAYGLAAPSPWFLAVNDYMREYIGFFKLYILDLA